jgi:hypothetical protein
MDSVERQARWQLLIGVALLAAGFTCIAVLLVAGNAQKGPEMIPFADVPIESPANILKERGLVVGVGDNNFAPARTMTRAEAAVIIVRLGDPEAAADVLPFGNAPWYEPWMNVAIDHGYVEVGADPNAPLTRLDVAWLVALSLSHIDR